MPAWLIYTLISVGLQIVATLIAPRPKTGSDGSVRDLEVPTAESGVTIKRSWGDYWWKSPQVIWYGDKSMKSYDVNA